MPSEKKYAIWPAIIISLLAVVAPITIGTIEMRIARNAQAETAVIDQLHAIAKAENEYHKANDSFSAKLEDLKTVAAPSQHYKIGYRLVSPDTYLTLAWPNEPGKHGKRYFFMDQTGVVRYEIMHAAGPASNEVPGPKAEGSSK
jgi:hypothetical protein